MEITKEFKWVMGHRLSFHKGGCFTPHGHNYRALLTLEGQLDKNGMLIDFGDIKKIFKKEIYDKLDHSFMIYEKDPYKKYLNLASKFFEKQIGRGFKIVVVDFETTAENIAKYIFDELYQYFNVNARLKKIEIYETDTSCAINGVD